MTMRPFLVALVALAACHASGGDDRATTTASAPVAVHDSADSVLHTPRFVTRPTVIVFWLEAGDTLHPDDASTAYQDLTEVTEAIVPLLAAFDIALEPTNADTVFVEMPNRRRRSVLLTGLELPFGYVLVEPGGVERVLPGVYGEEELLEEIRVYFDLPEGIVRTPSRVTA